MRRVFGLALALALAFGLAVSAHAQIGGGNIYGEVHDESQAVLPGASVTLSGPFTRSTVSTAEGQYRFINVPSGEYTLTVSMDNFTTVSRQVVVTTGQNYTIDFELKVAAVEETLLVTAETPVVDTKRVGTMTTITKAEATRIPNSRDPWAILRTIPGVFVDRVNIGGNESGQQSAFQGKGTDDADATWNLDGVQIDDMAAAGATPTYFDYDVFEEMAVTTGGNDISVQTGGIGLNFVTKRGTNQFHGSVRGYLVHDDMQWSNIGGTELENDPRLTLPDGSLSDKADHIEQIADFGADIGGPFIKDKLFGYFSYGKQDIRLRRTNQSQDKTVLETWNAKLNWQISQNTHFSGFFFNGKKSKIGRASGIFGFQEDALSLWDQGNQYENFMPLDIHGMLKFEVNHIFSPNFFMNVKYTNYDTGFELAARNSGPSTLNFVDGTVDGNAWLDISPIVRPLKNVTNVDGNYFFSGWGGQHELKFGFGYKKAPVSSTTVYGGKDGGLLGWNFGPGASTVWVGRDAVLTWEGEFFDFFVGDTFTKDRLTLNFGIRYDYQKSENTPAEVPAQKTFPDIIPGISFNGGGTGITWSNVSPRVAMTYALNESRRTVMRAAYSLYASKLDTGATTWDNPLGGSYSAYNWNDTNGDGLPQAAEVDLASGILYYGGYDPNNPTATISPDQLDPDYKAPSSHEIVVGLDHELMPELAFGVAYTWRRNNDDRNWDTRLGFTGPEDYIAMDTVSGNGYSVTPYRPNPDLVAQFASGSFRSNRPDYHQGYSGFEGTLTKRLSNRWMARVAFSYMDWKEYLGPGAIHNPAPTDSPVSQPGSGGPLVDGGQVAPRSGGSGKGDIFQNAKWQFMANGLYEIGYGFEVSAALYGRQGFPRPISFNIGAAPDGTNRFMATPNIDTLRYDNLWNLDLRLAKNMRLGDANLVFEGVLFNVFNSATVLNRQRNAASGAFDRLDEVLSPRVFRVGARLTF
jgi:hypothetical protein